MINIVLIEPEIPQNTGNIMRTCIATNSTLHLIKPLGFDLSEKKMRRSGVDYIDKINLVVYENIHEFFEKNSGEFYFLTRYGHKPPSDFDLSSIDSNFYFFFGRESTGIKKEILKPYLDRCMRLPMSSDVRSLNLSNTVAITVYEALSQQGYPGMCFDEPHKSKFEIENS